MNDVPIRKLRLFYRFFETYGTERLNGLSESHFVGLNDSEKEEAWNFLKDGFSLSAERIAGLYMLDQSRAVDLFKKTVSLPLVSSPFPAEQQALESNRLLMLRYINSADPDPNILSPSVSLRVANFQKYAQNSRKHYQYDQLCVVPLRRSKD